MDLLLLFRWAEKLKVGDRVRLRWTNSGTQWAGTAVLTKVNANSVLGKLEHQVGSASAYPEGRIITVPRPSYATVTGRWSWNNTVLPIDTSIIEK